MTRGSGLLGKLLALGVGGVLITAAVLAGVGIVQARAFSTEAHRSVDGLVDGGLDRVTLDAAAMVNAQSRGVQAKVDSDLGVARHVLAERGEVTLSPETARWRARNQYTGVATAVELPRMLVGGRWLGRNADPRVRTPVVDEVAGLVGGTATILRRMNARGDLLRIATNVRTKDGRRAVGTYIPARNPDGRRNPVAAAVGAGRTYRGVAFVVDDWHVTAYEPIRDRAGRVVGALYVGVRQDNLDTVRTALAGSRVGRNGSVAVLRGSGPQRGKEIFGRATSRAPAADRRRAQHTAAMAAVGARLRSGQVADGRYLAVTADGREVPTLYRVAYYAPWNWVIALTAPEAEFSGAQRAVQAGQRVMTGTLALVGLALTALGGTAAAAAARRLSRLQDQLAHQAFHDTLTGLANRTLFADRVEHALLRSRRDGAEPGVGVLFVDLDDFKTVNDSLGHDAGDALLVEVAERVRGCLRPADTAARLGGDEFAVLLEDLVDPAQAASVAERLLDSLVAPFLLAGKEVDVRASIGVATDLPDPAHLLSAADAAMYVAKSQGKSRYETFHPGMEAAATDRLALRVDLQRAIEQHELVLHYQPIVALATGRIVGVEALVRWEHPDRGLLPPGEFVPFAEGSGLIVPLGRWVLSAACRQAAHWRHEHPEVGLGLTVNLSGVQLLHPGCVADVAGALTAGGLDPAALTLEVTETMLVAEPAEARLAELKALGVELAIDDFGTGYSSLGYLRRFPLDLLKLDKSFVDDLGDGGERRVLVRSIIELGHALGLRTLAEGVETAAQCAALTELRCELGQGYHFSRPVPASDIAGLLQGGQPLGQAEQRALSAR